MTSAHFSQLIWKTKVDVDGFAVISDVVSTHEVTALLQRITESALPRSRAGFRHAMRHEGVARFAHDPRLCALAAEILGNTAVPFRATLFDKSPASNWLVVWHQDTALPISERREAADWGPWSVKDGITYAHAPASALEKVVALRVHLDNSNADNGPLRVLPATHNRGVLEDNAIRRLASEIAPVDCLAPAGGVIAMRPLVVHASSKSATHHWRRVLHIEYASSLDLPGGLKLAIA